MPDAPSIVETGQPRFPISARFALVAPSGLPPEIVARMHKEMAAALARPEVKEQMQRQGFAPRSSSPEELAAYMTETALKAAGIEPQ
jgi:tripartite-type tricarboxylate transporter receptor subunit TctC